MRDLSTDFKIRNAHVCSTTLRFPISFSALISQHQEHPLDFATNDFKGNFHHA